MITVYALLLVGIGTVVFHFVSPWWWTEIASNWGYIDDTIIITFWVTGVVFIAVILFMAYCVYKFRYQEGRRAEYKPESHQLEWWLTGLTAVVVAVMITPGLCVWNQIGTVPEGAAEVEVLAKQWTWGYRFPGKDGKLGKSGARNINDDNPFGIDPNDPNGKDDVVVDDAELHLPLNKPVKVLLRSIDVLHDFHVPQFRAKMDMVPGQITYFWFEPTRTGNFDVMCYELCGTGHYAMRGNVVVETEADFQKWLDEQTTFEEAMADVIKQERPKQVSSVKVTDREKSVSTQ